jgi:hypothetical protein
MGFLIDAVMHRGLQTLQITDDVLQFLAEIIVRT